VRRPVRSPRRAAPFLITTRSATPRRRLKLVGRRPGAPARPHLVARAPDGRARQRCKAHMTLQSTRGAARKVLALCQAVPPATTPAPMHKTAVRAPTVCASRGHPSLRPHAGFSPPPAQPFSRPCFPTDAAGSPTCWAPHQSHAHPQQCVCGLPATLHPSLPCSLCQASHPVRTPSCRHARTRARPALPKGPFLNP
jgi:hypothetical protein